MIVMIVCWLISIFLLLAVIGGTYKLSTQGFNWQEFITLLFIVFILVILVNIGVTGSFSVK
jgi:hypothetical protein